MKQLVCMLLVQAAVFATEVADVRRALELRQYRTVDSAYESLVSRAAAGDSEAMLLLEDITSDVDSAHWDLEQRLVWLAAAATAGNIEAAVQLYSRLHAVVSVLDASDRQRFLSRTSIRNPDEHLRLLAHQIDVTLADSAKKGDALALFRYGRYLCARSVNSETSSPCPDETGLRFVHAAAELGLLPAQRLLGETNALKGSEPGRLPYTSDGIRWLYRAAESGDASSQYLLGHIFSMSLAKDDDIGGEKVVRSLSTGREMTPSQLRDFYVKNNPDSTDIDMEALVREYLGRKGPDGKPLYAEVNRDRHEVAARWYERAAQQGHVDALVQVGEMYRVGLGVPQDYEKAEQYLVQAGKHGQLEAFYLLGLAELDVAKTTPTHFRRALELFLAASENESRYSRGAKHFFYHDAPAYVGALFESGNGTAKTPELAFIYRLIAAERGHSPSAYIVGMQYEHGITSKRDSTEAKKWFARSDGYAGGYWGEWIRTAANLGDRHAQYLLGDCLANGQGVEKDASKALGWYLRAARQGHTLAQIAVGRAFLLGIGTPQNYVTAHAWFNIAGSGGSSEALALRFTVEKRMTMEQVAAAQKLAGRLVDGNSGAVEGDPNKVPAVAATGTGFYVNDSGSVLTAGHVVEECRQLVLPSFGERTTARLVARDTENDLAILQVDTKGKASVHATFAQASPTLGQAVFAVGFPLRGVLASSLNFTTGVVSSLAGIGDDIRKIQITAPVQPGNSGGPLLDQAADVVGTISEKLDAVAVASATGDIPQNVNFAIRGSVIQLFLDAHDIKYSRARTVGAPMPSASAAEKAKGFTTLIECWK